MDHIVIGSSDLLLLVGLAKAVSSCEGILESNSHVNVMIVTT